MISEPITTATDYLLGVAALVGAIILWRAAARRGRASIRLWAGGFAAVAAAAVLGGTWHGFSPRLSEAAATRLWQATLGAGGIASFLLLVSAAVESVSPRASRVIVAAAAAKLVAFGIWSTSAEGFEPVVYDSAAAMLGILALQLIAWRRRRAPAAPWIAGGILVSLAAAGVEAFRIALPPLSPDDVYHLVQIGGLALLCRGGLLFGREAGMGAGARAVLP